MKLLLIHYVIFSELANTANHNIEQRLCLGHTLTTTIGVFSRNGASTSYTGHYYSFPVDGTRGWGKAT